MHHRFLLSLSLTLATALAFVTALTVPSTVRAGSACTVSSKLVNACRPWLGGTANYYKEGGKGKQNQIQYLEKRIGRQLDVVHSYHGVGDNALSDDDRYFATRSGTIVWTNWKPAEPWKEATGGNAQVNAGIDAMARSIKSVAPHKIMLAIYHEPEDQVTPGSVAACKEYSNKPKAGTPEDYRAMWANVRKRFGAAGVQNVVWVMNYMGFPKWNCMTDALWPGNNLVDWVVWDAYGRNATLPEPQMHMYDYLSSHSDAAHNYLSKPWGLGEWGVTGPQAHVYQQYANMKAALDTNRMPRLKLWSIWDSKDKADFRVGYDGTGQPDPKEQAAFNAFAQDPRFTDAFYLKGKK